ncbi:MAG: divalent-cation tolerance protein CutA, partial [Chromatiaceae bacterium]|nr:divalent-cation tolerance protein CutA [Chromatiaceae bacterium]
MDASYHLIYCTCPDHDTATRLAEQLVESRLAACVNVLPGLTSIYRWEARIEQASETLLLIKTRAARLAALLDALARA